MFRLLKLPKLLLFFFFLGAKLKLMNHRQATVLGGCPSHISKSQLIITHYTETLQVTREAIALSGKKWTTPIFTTKAWYDWGLERKRQRMKIQWWWSLLMFFFFFFDKECDLNKGERSVHSISVYTLACKVVFGPIKLPSNSTLA